LYLTNKQVFENFGAAITRLPPTWLRAWVEQSVHSIYPALKATYKYRYRGVASRTTD